MALMDEFRHQPHSMPNSEWDARVDLAAFYRLAALQGWDDLIFTHISARVPGPDRHFLINPFGLMFEEITASSLVKVDLDGNVIGDSAYGINYAGFVIHSAVHGAREDAHYVAHFHTRSGEAVSGQAEGLLPLNQRALTILPSLAYHDYEGVALHLDERERLIADLGDKTLMILRNHGTLAIGASAGEAWMNIYQLERACEAQVLALSCGRDRLLFAPEEAQNAVAQPMPDAAVRATGNLYDTVWKAALRKAERASPGFDC
jgi:ribulose-5-phosphate 4-epimerase/fuculose-1-phosphate aldolase